MPQPDTQQQTVGTSQDEEFKALEKVVKALGPLDENAKKRILNYAVSRFANRPDSLATEP
jgi:hypothetical protein